MSAAPEEKPAEGGGKNPLMLLIVVLLVVVIALVSTFGYLFLTKSDEAMAEDGEQKKPVKVVASDPPVFEKMDPFVLNLASGSGILQVECQAELSDAAHAVLIKAYMPKIRSALILLLTSKSADELSTPEGKARLRNQIRQVINETVSDSGVDNAVTGVVFTSLIIQS